MKKPTPRPRARLHVSLPDDAARRLRAYAAWHNMDLGDVVAAAIRPLLAGFRVAPGTSCQTEATDAPGEQGRGAA